MCDLDYLYVVCVCPLDYHLAVRDGVTSLEDARWVEQATSNLYNLVLFVEHIVDDVLNLVESQFCDFHLEFLSS